MADRSLYSETSSPMPTGLEFLDQYGDRGTQLFNAAIWPLSSVGGTANAVTASCDPPLLAGLVEHMKFLITWAADNTGGMTLAIDGGTPVPILTASGSAMQAGDALTGVRVILEYVGGAFRVIGGASSGSAAGPYVTTITASGTWVKPTGYADDALVILEAWGGGGGGARSTPDAGGGGGGAYARREMRYADVPSSISITIGAGGAGRAGSTGNGTAGGNTTVGSLLTAYRGAGGLSTGLGGGGGGELEAGTGSTGGSVGGGNSNAPASTPSGGAGGGGSGAAGKNAIMGGASGGAYALAGTVGGKSMGGGDGGNGGANAANPTAGAAPGGGGGGAVARDGAAGARGEVRIRIVG